MIDPDIETADALALLSADAPSLDPPAWSRRRFLQLVGMGAGAGLTGAALFEAVGATLAGFDPSAFAAPVGPDEGIVVVLGMYGGNDGVATVVPTADGPHYDQRGALALAPEATLPLNERLGLHPALGSLKQRWDNGQLAIVEGVGYPDPDLSHFTSMAIWMSAIRHGPPSSGWLGRWLDGHLAGGPDLYAAASIGSRVPLHVIGQSRRATAVPPRHPGFGSGTSDADARLYDAVRALAAPAGAGPWRDAVAAALRDQVDLAATLGPIVPSSLPPAPLTASLEVAARLINADLGFRVLETGWGDFDSHADQRQMHDARMTELDAAVRRFFEVLDPVWGGRVTVMTFSEFGRTPYANGSAGTDHGTASSMLVFGDHVRGGTYGQHASTAGLARWERPDFHVDVRSYYASILDGWLGGGSSDVLGGQFEDLGVFASPPSTSPGGSSGGSPGGSSGESSGGSTGGVPVAGPSAGGSTTGGSTTGGSTTGGSTGGFRPISPTRLVDTRDGTGGVPASRLGPGATLRVPVAGRHAIPPSGVVAVVANITAVDVSVPTYVTAWPASTARPPTSNLNPVPGRATPNLAVVGVGGDGAIDVFNADGETHLIVDVFGYVAVDASDGFVPAGPVRVVDTRSGLGAPAGEVRRTDRIDVRVTGRGGIPDAGVRAVVLNLTAVEPRRDGYLTVGPGGEPIPPTSNLNFTAGRTVPNLVVCKVGADGRVSVAVDTDGVHVLADVFGWFGAGGAPVTTLAPARLLDTRDGTGGAAGRLGPGDEIAVPVAGRGGVPAGARAVVLNLTATDVSAATHVSAWPDGTTRPDTSNLNPAAGDTVANLTIVGLGDGGRVRFANAAGEAALIADVFGYVAD